MGFRERQILGKTGLTVCRLGVASSFGAPTEAFEEAFERGVNYFYWGSMRKTGMARAIRNLIAGGKRDDLVIVIQSYSRSAALMELFYRKALKALGIERADIMLLGWHDKEPSARIMDRAMKMKDKGLFRFLGLSGHNRRLFPRLAKDDRFDLFHVRYNAAHRGAEQDIFEKMPQHNRPGLVTYTATRWGDLVRAKWMPPGEEPLRGADCYRFALSHPMVDVCITGPKNREEMQEALAALDLGPPSGRKNWHASNGSGTMCMPALRGISFDSLFLRLTRLSLNIEVPSLSDLGASSGWRIVGMGPRQGFENMLYTLWC